MATDNDSTPTIPPEILNYLHGATDKNLEFDFLIGNWSVAGKRYDPKGEVQLTYSGTWHAQYLRDKRIVLDDFTVHAPNGDAVSSFITLRTYSPLTQRWEMAGLGALQPAMNGKWYGELREGEMHLTAEGTAPDGRKVVNRIRFHAIEPDSFQWESHLSFDEGTNWMRNASLVATRAPN